MIITLTIHLHYLIFSLGVIMLCSAVERTNVSFMNYIEYYSLVTQVLLRRPSQDNGLQQMGDISKGLANTL